MKKLEGSYPKVTRRGKMFAIVGNITESKNGGKGGEQGVPVSRESNNDWRISHAQKVCPKMKRFSSKVGKKKKKKRFKHSGRCGTRKSL